MLFSLLMIHLLCSFFSFTSDVGGTGEGAKFNVCRSEISAFQKITLGIPISVNSEGIEGLTAVPGIGPGIAGRIVRERNKNGDFKTLDEIKTIRGIGPGLYAKMRIFLVL